MLDESEFALFVENVFVGCVVVGTLTAIGLCGEVFVTVGGVIVVLIGEVVGVVVVGAGGVIFGLVVFVVVVFEVNDPVEAV